MGVPSSFPMGVPPILLDERCPILPNGGTSIPGQDGGVPPFQIRMGVPHPRSEGYSRVPPPSRSGPGHDEGIPQGTPLSRSGPRSGWGVPHPSSGWGYPSVPPVQVRSQVNRKSMATGCMSLAFTQEDFLVEY